MQHNAELYVLSGTYRQAADFAISRECPQNRLRFVNEACKLRGIKGEGKTLFVYGTAMTSPHYRECLRMAQERGFKIEYI